MCVCGDLPRCWLQKQCPITQFQACNGKAVCESKLVRFPLAHAFSGSIFICNWKNCLRCTAASWARIHATSCSTTWDYNKETPGACAVLLASLQGVNSSAPAQYASNTLAAPARKSQLFSTSAIFKARSGLHFGSSSSKITACFNTSVACEVHAGSGTSVVRTMHFGSSRSKGATLVLPNAIAFEGSPQPLLQLRSWAGWLGLGTVCIFACGNT